MLSSLLRFCKRSLISEYGSFQYNQPYQRCARAVQEHTLRLCGKRGANGRGYVNLQPLFTPLLGRDLKISQRYQPLPKPPFYFYHALPTEVYDCSQLSTLPFYTCKAIATSSDQSVVAEHSIRNDLPLLRRTSHLYSRINARRTARYQTTERSIPTEHIEEQEKHSLTAAFHDHAHSRPFGRGSRPIDRSDIHTTPRQPVDRFYHAKRTVCRRHTAVDTVSGLSPCVDDTDRNRHHLTL